MDVHGEKEQKSNPEIVTLDKAAHLGPTVCINGELSGTEDLVIEGQFQGKVNVNDHILLISRQARVEGEIRGRDIYISGEVNGDIFASGKVTLTAEGRIKGNISAAKISIADGAQFKGSVRILPEKLG